MTTRVWMVLLVILAIKGAASCKPLGSLITKNEDLYPKLVISNSWEVACR